MKTRSYTNNSRIGIFVMYIVAAILFLNLSAAAVFADGSDIGTGASDTNAKDANNMPYTVSVPIEYAVKGVIPDAGGDTFMLTPSGSGEPMPDGSDRNVSRIRIKKPGKYSFDEIVIRKPGVYEYSIRRNVTEKKGVRKDDSVFRVKIVAENTGEAHVVTYISGSEKKSPVVYTDRVSVFGTPKTGDDIDPVYIGMFICAGIALMLFFISGLRGRRYQNKQGW